MNTTPHQDELPAAIAPHPLLQDALFCYAAGEDGAHAVLVRGWQALYKKLRDDAGIEASDEALNDIDEWSMDGDRVPYSFSLNFEGDWVSIYRVSESTAQALPCPDEYATEICRLHNVIQAACIGGTDMMLERWKALFPDAPVPTVKAQSATPPAGFALVPLRLTQAMTDVIGDEDWTWEDLLAAAEAITEQQYAEITSMVAVCAENAESYCRILTALGMEEEGDPVAEVERLIGLDEAQPANPEHLPTKEHIRELAQEAFDQVMEQAQVFASAWSLVGGPFDSGNALSDAEEAKAELRTMVRSLAALAAETVRPVDAPSDTELLDFMASQRVAVIPEFEGPWDAQVYGDEGKVQRSASGSCPRQAIRAAMQELPR